MFIFWKFCKLRPQKLFSSNDATSLEIYEYFIASVYRNRTVQGCQQIIQSQVTHVNFEILRNQVQFEIQFSLI